MPTGKIVSPPASSTTATAPAGADAATLSSKKSGKIFLVQVTKADADEKDEHHKKDRIVFIEDPTGSPFKLDASVKYTKNEPATINLGHGLVLGYGTVVV